jgi:acyl-CoA hydrolase
MSAAFVPKGEGLPPWVWRAARRATSPPARGSAPRVPGDTRSVLTYRTGVGDANIAGDVHGGWIMKLCDDVAVIAASRHAESRVVTLAVDGVLFRSPVRVGDVLTLKATVNAAWRSSMEVGVRVEAESLHGGDACHTLTAYVTMVALDADGRTAPVAALTPVTSEDERRWHEAHLRRRIRLTDPADLRRRLVDLTDAEVAGAMRTEQPG